MLLRTLVVLLGDSIDLVEEGARPLAACEVASMEAAMLYSSSNSRSINASF